MNLSYDKIKASFKSLMMEKINDISFGNLAYEVIEEIEKSHEINLPDDLVAELLVFAEGIGIVIPDLDNLKISSKTLDC